ncbi:unnamed protein product [Caretta caretta]
MGPKDLVQIPFVPVCYASHVSEVLPLKTHSERNFCVARRTVDQRRTVLKPSTDKNSAHHSYDGLGRGAFFLELEAKKTIASHCE